MKGLLLRDLYNLKLYFRQYLLVLVCFCVFGIGMDMPSYMMWMSLVIGINLSFSAFTMDEAGGYAYLLSCPLDRKDLVLEKYLTVILNAVMILAYSALGEFLNHLIKGTGTESWLATVFVVQGIYFLVTSVLVPVAYRYGVEKTRIVMMLIILTPVVVILVSVKILDMDALIQISGASRSLFDMLPYLFFAASLMVFGGSYLISLKVFEKMEF